MHGSGRAAPPPDSAADDVAEFISGGASGGRAEQGPDFYASFDGDCEAAVCLEGGRIWEGDLIRAVGYQEYAHSGCAEAEADDD